jgi:hypothetical protein
MAKNSKTLFPPRNYLQKPKSTNLINKGKPYKIQRMNKPITKPATISNIYHKTSKSSTGLKGHNITSVLHDASFVPVYY